MSLEPFTQHQGVAAPLLRINVDTDAIIPSREMKTVSKSGLAEGLFAGWRYINKDGTTGSREPNPDFVLNQPGYGATSILLSGANFGCGSSREHAVWALKEYGIRAIIAPSFGTIFYGNCVRNGLLPIELADDTVKAIAAEVEADPAGRPLAIDLEACTVRTASGKSWSFTIDANVREMLLQGLDHIDLTLKHASAIATFRAEDQSARPWLYR